MNICGKLGVSDHMCVWVLISRTGDSTSLGPFCNRYVEKFIVGCRKETFSSSVLHTITEVLATYTTGLYLASAN